MKFTSFTQIFSLAAVALASQSSDVVELAASNFTEYASQHDIVLAEFFAPWCGHCKNLAPEYEQVATDLKSNKKISIAKIDCDQADNRPFCQEQGVQGFPTLYVYEDGKQSEQYDGPRKAADIKKFLLKRAQPAVTDVKNLKGFDKWVKENHEENPIVVLYLGDKKNVDTFAKVAKSKRAQLAFVSAVGDADLRKKYDADVVIFKDGEKEPTLLETKLTSENLEQFIKENEFVAFGELGPETYKPYVDSKTPMLYAFVNTSDSRDLFKKALTPHLSDLKGHANVVFLNATLYGLHSENLNLRKEQYPALVVHDTVSNKKYIHDQDTEITEKSISEFVKKYLKGEIPANVKSEPIPEKQGNVVTLVGKQYDEIVLDDSKDVLVEYYAPWCGHCKNLAPIYEELGELYADNDKVVIAQLDHTANEVPDEILGYPTIKFYPAGKKDEPITFKDSRTLEGLSAFIEKEATNNAKPKRSLKDVKKAVEKKRAEEKEDVKDEL